MTSDNEKLVEQSRSNSSLNSRIEESNKKHQSVINGYELEVNKLQGLLRSKQEEKDQIVSAYSKLIKGYDHLKREFSNIKGENARIKDKMDKIKLQHLPSEIKAELEKELDLIRSENQRLREAYNSIESERNKWRVGGGCCEFSRHLY